MIRPGKVLAGLLRLATTGQDWLCPANCLLDIKPFAQFHELTRVPPIMRSTGSYSLLEWQHNPHVIFNSDASFPHPRLCIRESTAEVSHHLINRIQPSGMIMPVSSCRERLQRINPRSSIL